MCCVRLVVHCSRHHYETCRPFITFNWAAGCLRNEQASLSAIPVKEMRQALCACYERR